MDRRQFLKLFSAASLSAIAPPHLLASFEDRRFVSPVLGFSFDIPPGWSQPKIEEIKQNLGKQTFIEEYRGEDAYKPTPLVAVYRHKEPFVGMNPGIWIYADKYEPWMASTHDFAQSYVDYFTTIVEDGTIVAPPSSITLGGIEGTQSTISYHGIVEADNFSCYVLDQTRFVIHRGNIIAFLFEQSLDGSARADAEFAAVDGSIRFY